MGSQLGFDQPGQVIYDVDTALRLLVVRELAAAGAVVDVVFDAPTKDWASRRNGPTVDVYLYDIREDLRRRERGFHNEYEGRRVVARNLPPRHFKLSYLVTAWTQRPEDEHRLLSSLLSCFLAHDALPTDLLAGALAETGSTVPVSVGLPPPEDRSFADVWSALGGELKPSLDIVVTAPAGTGQRLEVGPPVLEPLILPAGGIGDWPTREVRVRRIVPDAAVPVEPAGEPAGRASAAPAASRNEASGSMPVARRRRRPAS